MSKADLHENPLVPNKKLRALYLAMVEARVLDEHNGGRTAGGKKQSRRHSTRGEEACRVSTAIDLQLGDLVSDTQPGATLGVATGIEAANPLLSIGSPGERLRLAMGAALSLKILKRGSLVVAYARQGEIERRDWRKILKIASQLDLPIFFVLLPADAAAKRLDKTLIKRLKSCGVPGITVDANDAVALYRVAQETYGRIRGGGGPVFMECAAFSLQGSRNVPAADCILQMKEHLLGRRVAPQSWLDAAGSALRLRLEKAIV